MKRLLVFCLSVFVFLAVNGQDTYKIAEGSSVTIQGSSTLHDWELVSSSVEGNAVFVVDNNTPSEIKSASLSVKVEKLKSGKSGLDNNAYKAMKVENFPEVTFELTSASSEPADSEIRFILEGNMSVAGIEKPISMAVVCETLDSKIICSGEQGLQMTDYEIDPPTALFGTVKANDEVTLLCDITFVR